jgi:Tol biopolymer transport system component
MKKTLFVAATLVAVAAAQTVELRNATRIETNENLYYPVFDPSGERLAATADDYRGLWLVEIADGATRAITDAPGAGYHPAFSADGGELFYRRDKFEGGRRTTAVEATNLKTGAETTLLPFSRDVDSPTRVSEDRLAVAVGGALRAFSADEEARALPGIDRPYATIENQKIALYLGGEKRILAPRGDGNYIWPSVSPDGERVLFTFAGEGTYVCDLEGEILASIGYANAPKWSPDGERVVYMVDEDDGRQFIGSEIYVSDADGANRRALTATDDRIEMYPDWSPKGDRLAFCDDRGNLYIADIIIE